MQNLLPFRSGSTLPLILRSPVQCGYCERMFYVAPEEGVGFCPACEPWKVREVIQLARAANPER